MAWLALVVDLHKSVLQRSCGSRPSQANDIMSRTLSDFFVDTVIQLPFPFRNGYAQPYTHRQACNYRPFRRCMIRNENACEEICTDSERAGVAFVFNHAARKAGSLHRREWYGKSVAGTYAASYLRHLYLLLEQFCTPNSRGTNNF